VEERRSGNGRIEGALDQVSCVPGVSFCFEWTNMGILQVAHGCVEKSADEQGLMRGVEQSTIEQMEAPIQA
jgi:hypothetical protein